MQLTDSPITEIDEVASNIVRLLRRSRISLGGEIVAQDSIERALTSAGFAFEREKRLAPRDIVDFLVEPGIAIEVKIAGSKRAIYAQCKRYCEHGAVRGIILASSVPMGLPPLIEGKPAWLASLGRGWL